METTLTAIHILMMVGGAVIIGVYLFRLVLSDWPDPLQGAPIRMNVLSLPWLWACLLTYAASGLISTALAQLLVSGALPEAARANSERIVATSMMYGLVASTCLLIARLTFRAGWCGFGLGRRPLLLNVRDAVYGLLVATCLCGVVAWLTEHLIRMFSTVELPRHSVFEALGDPGVEPVVRVLAIIGALLIAPIGEEMLFRGIIQTGLKRLMPVRFRSMRHRWVAIGITGLVFGLMHYPTPHYVPALITLGVILGFLYERTGSLTVPILLHILFNGKTLLWYHLQSLGT